MHKEETAPPKTHFKRLRIWLIVTTFLLIILCVGGFLLLHKTTALPQSVTSSLSFPVYYPTSLPAGYQLDKSTVKVQDQRLFYQFKKGPNTIYVIEQVAPDHPPDLKNLNGFGQVSTITGEAVLGTANSQPTGILLTKSTLVTVDGSKGMPVEQIGTLLQSLRSVQ
ncbi:MAG: hypothetical protein WDN27_03835 [Candidatus Saccharibacteria bacterium]